VRITGASDFASEVGSENIAAAIDEELSGAKIARVATPAKPMSLPAAVAAASKPSSPKLPQGGVGLGLPYTGPTGEPIFGLTPEQRLAQATANAASETTNSSSIASALEPDGSAIMRAARPRTGRPAKRRWPLYAAILGGAIAIGVVIAIVTRPGSSEPDNDVTIDPASLAGQANAVLEAGQPNKAITMLEGNKVAIAQDPLAQLVLGHAYAAKHASKESLTAYTHALELNADLGANAMLRANLRAMAADKDVAVVATAFEIWVQTGDSESKPLLLKAAVSQDLERRHAVRPVIERRKLLDQVDLLAAYTLDLDQEATCELRKEAVARLRALNDARAVPALERALVKKIKSGTLRNKPYSPCLADDAKAAIGYLRGLPKKS
jgi:hypothetical protein